LRLPALLNLLMMLPLRVSKGCRLQQLRYQLLIHQKSFRSCSVNNRASYMQILGMLMRWLACTECATFATVEIKSTVAQRHENLQRHCDSSWLKL
jgi:hypothetical protein